MKDLEGYFKPTACTLFTESKDEMLLPNYWRSAASSRTHRCCVTGWQESDGWLKCERDIVC